MKEIDPRKLGRFIRKIMAADYFLNRVPDGQVVLGDGRREHPIQRALAGEGTVIANRPTLTNSNNPEVTNKKQ